MLNLRMVGLLLIGVLAIPAGAQEPLPLPAVGGPVIPPTESPLAKPSPAMRGSLQATEAAHARAGSPLRVAPWARLTYGSDYAGYLVGGGKAPTKYPRKVQAEPPYPHEGTWGMDYAPWWSKVDLLWSHGQLYQGGPGQYEPDHKNFPFDQRFGRRIEERE